MILDKSKQLIEYDAWKVDKNKDNIKNMLAIVNTLREK